MSDALPSILAFLEAIGIGVREGQVGPDSFLPGVRVERGALVYDRGHLRWPGDLLHEAGHIAVTPTAGRARLDDRIQAEYAVPHAGEVEAIAWSYAAIVHLRLDPAVLFHAEGYRGQSQALLSTFAYGVYPGAYGLMQAGMTLVGSEAAAAGLPSYPHMLRWLRD